MSAEMATFVDGDLCIDFDQQAVTKGGETVRLLSWEFGVLAALVRQEGRVHTTNELFEAGWGSPGEQMPKRVMYAVLRLRYKLGWGGDNWDDYPIEKVKGVGYRYRGHVG